MDREEPRAGSGYLYARLEKEGYLYLGSPAEKGTLFGLARMFHGTAHTYSATENREVVSMISTLSRRSALATRSSLFVRRAMSSKPVALLLGDKFPDFEAETTEVRREEGRAPPCWAEMNRLTSSATSQHSDFRTDQQPHCWKARARQLSWACLCSKCLPSRMLLFM